MRTLRRGMKGDDVALWQRWLGVSADGVFGPVTEHATKSWQLAEGLEADGIVGPLSRARAVELGLDPTGGFPERPNGVRRLTNARREALYGSFQYVAAPTDDNPEAIRILDGWEGRNIVRTVVPWPAGTRSVRFHRLGADRLVRLFEAWEAAGLLGDLKTFDGGYAPRFVRGSKTTLSNHSFGTAFDINAKWNARRTLGAPVGVEGSVRRLVPLAVAHGFYWGGWFSTPDPMHFELRE